VAPWRENETRGGTNRENDDSPCCEGKHKLAARESENMVNARLKTQPIGD